MHEITLQTEEVFVKYKTSLFSGMPFMSLTLQREPYVTMSTRIGFTEIFNGLSYALLGSKLS